MGARPEDDGSSPLFRWLLGQERVGTVRRKKTFVEGLNFRWSTLLQVLPLGAVLLMEEILRYLEYIYIYIHIKPYKLNDMMAYLPYHLVSGISSINRELQK